ncbi:uncharacterized protein LOC135393146 [Ornithodoros turicata]|uniref:uncharacterized protein LOC135393146 n=1 Tax=Ornithodoros turicata TaxID=34597 RepID=UPI003139CAC3
MKLWPPLQEHHITYYLLKSKASDLEDVQALKSLDSYNYLISGKVGRLLVYQTDSDTCFLKGTVSPSQADEYRTYQAWVCVTSDCRVLWGSCTSKVGLTRVCSHVGAILWKIEFANRKGLTGQSCTDRSASWNHGTKRNFVPSQVLDMDFSMAKNIRHASPTNRKVSVPRYEDHKTYVKAMKESEIAPLLDIRASLLHQTVFASLPSNVQTSCCSQRDTVPEHGSHNEPELLACELCFEFYSQWVKIEESSRQRLMKLTCQQSGDLWQASRNLRLTASNLSKVPRRKDTAPDKFIKSCLFSTFRGNKATSHGKKFEPVARKAFENSYGVCVELCGTVVSATHPFLSASPDGLVGTDSILEIKCPHTEDCVQFVHTCKYDVRRDTDGRYYLAKEGKNGYYMQVQFVMFCSERSKCYFHVWSALNSIIIEVTYDVEYVAMHITRFSEFYFRHYLPRLVDAVHSKNLALTDEYKVLCSER